VPLRQIPVIPAQSYTGRQSVPALPSLTDFPVSGGPLDSLLTQLSDILNCPELGEIRRFEELIQQTSETAPRRTENAIVEFLKGNTETK
jgi:hypothetical protein